MVDLTSRHWTHAERLHWREQVTPPLAVISLIFCVFAAIIYYIFPRLRVFPRSILSWVNSYNIIFDAYLIAKWFPSSVLHNPMVVKLKPGTAGCIAGIFLDNFTKNGLVACDMLIALTVFMVIKMGVDFESNKSYYHQSYLLFAVGFPLLISLVATFGFSTEAEIGNPCVVSSAFGKGLIAYPSIILLGIQVILLIWAMAYVREVISSIKSVHTSNFPVKYLLVRFIATFIAQIYNIFGEQIYVLLPSTQHNAIFARFAFVSHASGGTVDAIILILANVDFMNWVRSKLDESWKSNSREASAEDTKSPVAVSMSKITAYNEGTLASEVVIPPLEEEDAPATISRSSNTTMNSSQQAIIIPIKGC